MGSSINVLQEHLNNLLNRQKELSIPVPSHLYTYNHVNKERDAIDKLIRHYRAIIFFESNKTNKLLINNYMALLSRDSVTRDLLDFYWIYYNEFMVTQ